MDSFKNDLPVLERWLIFGVLMGIVLGLIPLIYGYKKKEIKLAYYGFFASIIGGSAIGFILALPVSALFSYLIYRKHRPEIEFDDKIDEEK